MTPTVVFNVCFHFVNPTDHFMLMVLQGVVENGISSSFTAEQWLEWLEKNVI